MWLSLWSWIKKAVWLSKKINKGSEEVVWTLKQKPDRDDFKNKWDWKWFQKAELEYKNELLLEDIRKRKLDNTIDRGCKILWSRVTKNAVIYFVESEEEQYVSVPGRYVNRRWIHGIDYYTRFKIHTFDKMWNLLGTKFVHSDEYENEMAVFSND